MLVHVEDWAVLFIIGKIIQNGLEFLKDALVMYVCVEALELSYQSPEALIVPTKYLDPKHL